jgi:hypothetical protein
VCKSARLAILLVCLSSASAGAAPASDCTTQEAVLSKELSELPRIEAASPRDRPPYCITLETVMAFAARLNAHVAHCPNSDHASSVADWDKTRSDYSKLFGQYRCRPTLSKSRL